MLIIEVKEFTTQHIKVKGMKINKTLHSCNAYENYKFNTLSKSLKNDVKNKYIE